MHSKVKIMTEFYQLTLATADVNPQQGVVVRCCICTSIIKGISDQYKNPICIPCGHSIKQGQLEGNAVHDEED